MKIYLNAHSWFIYEMKTQQGQPYIIIFLSSTAVWMVHLENYVHM